MKKRAASLALVLSMILSFTCQAGAVDANSGDDGQQVSTYAALEASAQSGGLTKLNAVKYILLDCGMKETQFPSVDSDYIAMAKSVASQMTSSTVPQPARWKSCTRWKTARQLLTCAMQ